VLSDANIPGLRIERIVCDSVRKFQIPLISAVRHGDVDMVSLLLAHKGLAYADTQSTDYYSCTVAYTSLEL